MENTRLNFSSQQDQTESFWKTRHDTTLRRRRDAADENEEPRIWRKMKMIFYASLKGNVTRDKLRLKLLPCIVFFLHEKYCKTICDPFPSAIPLCSLSVLILLMIMFFYFYKDNAL